MGENEAGVREQVRYSRLAEQRPGTVAQAITLAKILDDPQMKPMHPQTSRQLHTLLTSLDGPKKKSGGRLAMVSAMSGRKAQ
jgi:hypothetical protein